MSRNLSFSGRVLLVMCGSQVVYVHKDTKISYVLDSRKKLFIKEDCRTDILVEYKDAMDLLAGDLFTVDSLISIPQRL